MLRMPWHAYFHPRFKAEFDQLAPAVQNELFAMLTPLRRYGLLVAGDKSGGSERSFYRRLIAKADKRYKEHLDGL